MASILILYSSPANEDRLRLDREHKRVEAAIELAGGGNATVARHHAVTLEDMARAIAKHQFDIIHFSGHGSSDGFCFEVNGSDDGQLVSSEHLAKILKASQSSLSALILISCYSADTALTLLHSSPYVVSISGPADDDAAIDFVGHFYEEYFRCGSIEQAFNFSSAVVDGRLNTVLGHRSNTVAPDPKSPTTIAVYRHQHHCDPIYVDYSQARKSIAHLDISIDRFLTILSRKIRVHHWIFEGERESAIVPIAEYFAAFSWKNAKDVVQCLWVRKPKPELPLATLELIAQMIVSYNDLYMSAYRTSEKRAQDQSLRHLKYAIGKMHEVHQYFLATPANYTILESILPNQIKMLRANCWANLQKADEKLAIGDYSSATIHAETSLSTIHDAVEGLVDAISIQNDG